MGQREREIADTTDPAVVLERLRHALRALAADWDRAGDDAHSHLPTHCLDEHEHCACDGDEPDEDCDDHCDQEAYVEDGDDVEWDAMATSYGERAAQLRELLARPDLQPPPGTTREA